MTYTPKVGDTVTSTLLVGEWEVENTVDHRVRVVRNAPLGPAAYVPIDTLTRVEPEPIFVDRVKAEHPVEYALASIDGAVAELRAQLPGPGQVVVNREDLRQGISGWRPAGEPATGAQARLRAALDGA